MTKALSSPFILLSLLPAFVSLGQESLPEDRHITLRLEGGSHSFEIQRIYPDRVLVEREGGVRFTFHRDEVKDATNAAVSRILEEAKAPLRRVDHEGLSGFPDLLGQLDQHRVVVEEAAHTYGWLIPGASESLALLSAAHDAVGRTLSIVQRIDRQIDNLRQASKAGKPVPEKWEEEFGRMSEAVAEIPVQRIRQSETARVEGERQEFASELERRRAVHLERLEDMAEEISRALAEGSLSRSDWTDSLQRMKRTAELGPNPASIERARKLVAEFETENEPLLARQDLADQLSSIGKQLAAIETTTLTSASSQEEIGTGLQVVAEDVESLPDSATKEGYRRTLSELHTLLLGKQTPAVTDASAQTAPSSALPIGPNPPRRPDGTGETRGRGSGIHQIFGGAVAVFSLAVLFLVLRLRRKPTTRPLAPRRVFVQRTTDGDRLPKKVEEAPIDVAIPKQSARVTPAGPSRWRVAQPPADREAVQEKGTDESVPAQEETPPEPEEPGTPHPLPDTIPEEYSEAPETSTSRQEALTPGPVSSQDDFRSLREEEPRFSLEGPVCLEPETPVTSTIGSFSPTDVIGAEDEGETMGGGVVFEGVRPVSLVPLGDCFALVGRKGERGWVSLIRHEAGKGLIPASAEVDCERVESIAYRSGILWVVHDEGIDAHAPESPTMRHLARLFGPSTPSPELGASPQPLVFPYHQPLWAAEGCLFWSWSGRGAKGFFVGGVDRGDPGKRLWAFEPQASSEHDVPLSHLISHQGQVGFVGRNGEICLLDASTGTEVGTASPPGIWVSKARPVACSLFDRNFVYLKRDSDSRTSLAAYQLADSKLGPETEVTECERPSVFDVSDGLLFFSEKQLAYFEKDDLSEIWSVPLEGQRPLGFSCEGSQIVFLLADEDGTTRVLVLGRNSGTTLWRVSPEDAGATRIGGIALHQGGLLVWGETERGDGLVRLLD